MPKLVEARYVSGFVIWFRFSDGVEGEVDLAGELQGPIFEPLRDPAYFRLFALNPGVHTIAWPTGADLAPEFLHERIRVRRNRRSKRARSIEPEHERLLRATSNGLRPSQ